MTPTCNVMIISFSILSIIISSTKEPKILRKVNNNILIGRGNIKLFFYGRSTKEQSHIQLADKYLLVIRESNVLIYKVVTTIFSNYYRF